MIWSLLLSVIFFLLGMIHFHWAFGGKYGFEHTLPTNEQGKRMLNPRKIDSAIVGLGLVAFGLFYFFQTGLIAVALPGWIIKYVGWIIPSIFLLRAIGDFKYVGFFKKIKQTSFGRRDTKVFSPLCFIIAVVGFAIQWNVL